MYKSVALALLAAMLLLFSCVGASAEEVPAATESSANLDGDRDSLRQAQQRLIHLGYLNGSADGVYGPMTEAALRSFQRDNGLEETGHLDEISFVRLTEISPDDADAKDIQQRLIDLGYLQGSADGIIGPKSVEALKLFQRLNGLTANGKADFGTKALLFSGAAIAMPASLSSGSKGEDVEALQRKLAQFGFFSGEADGAYGQSTASAVKAFQNHIIAQGYSEGITANGTATPLTQYVLFNDQYSTYLRDVQPDEKDSEALRAQRRLYALGYMDREPTDTLDEYARAAVRLFQQQAMAQPDGLVDRETVEALFAAEAPVAEHCAPHAVASGDKGRVVEDVERALVHGGMMIKVPNGKYNTAVEDALERLRKYLLAVGDEERAALFADPKSLPEEAVVALQGGLLGYRSDDMDDEVEAARVQRRLYSLYYLDRSGVDGKFGSNSRDALREFQVANKIFETGTADRATQEYLFSSRALAKPYPYRVEVSIDRQAVDIYQLNEAEEYELVQTFKCSTGLHDTTPRGIFLDGFPVNRWHHFEKFNCWAQYSFEVTGDIMFHSVIYSSDNENSLRSGSLYALGNPASHGCIRLSVEDAKWLFEHCKRGKLVIVIY